MHDGASAPAGWYPAGEGERYWDGRASTPHTRPPMAPPVAATDVHGLPHHTPDAAWRQAGWPPPASAPGPSGMVGTPVYLTQVAPKSPAVSALASFFVPGLGSMINGDVG